MDKPYYLLTGGHAYEGERLLFAFNSLEAAKKIVSDLNAAKKEHGKEGADPIAKQHGASSFDWWADTYYLYEVTPGEKPKSIY